MNLLITGGAGFIGSALVRQIIADTDATVVNLDALAYAGNLESLGGIVTDVRHRFECVDITDVREVERVFREHRPDAVVHLAAESHVDRSIQGPGVFIETNVRGTCNLLEVARAYWSELDHEKQPGFRFHHVSTDEVYGDLGADDPPFTEECPYAPSSPYAASKASSDHLIRAWNRTYGLPVVITNCSNNYGPYQFPEKLIPLVILNALDGKTVPVYGCGENVRDWLYVEDHVRALRLVLQNGTDGRAYNIGGRCERSNLEVVRAICSILDELAPGSNGPYDRQIAFVADRPGHDRRYAMDNTRIATELGWQPEETFESGLRKTVQWYLNNQEWVERVRSGAYREWIEANYSNRGQV